MNYIEYKGKKYPTRTFEIERDGEAESITIATDSLSDALGAKKEREGSREEEIDNEIYFYVLNDVIDFSPEEICADHLDEPLVFVEEEI